MLYEPHARAAVHRANRSSGSPDLGLTAGMQLSALSSLSLAEARPGTFLDLLRRHQPPPTLERKIQVKHSKIEPVQ